MVQEADLRLAEIKKATYEFDRDVLRGAVNPVSLEANFQCSCIVIMLCVCVCVSMSQRTQRIMGEKVVKYFGDRLKSRVSYITFMDIVIAYTCTCTCIFNKRTCSL